MDRPTVVLADDHKILMEGLRSLLEPDFDLLATVEDGRELVEKALPLRELEELAAGDEHVASDIRTMKDILENSPGLAWPHRWSSRYRAGPPRAAIPR